MNDNIELLDQSEECIVKENMNRNRPYLGQSHTSYGERGKTYVQGMTMRDLCDCFVRGFINAANHVVPGYVYQEAQKGEDANLDSNDLYGFDLDKVDPGAIRNNMMVEIEKMMGIFPNIIERTDTPIEVEIEDNDTSVSCPVLSHSKSKE